MNELEFYIFENELWCMYPDGSNQIVTESDTELVRGILEKIMVRSTAKKKFLEAPIVFQILLNDILMIHSKWGG